MIDTTNPGFWSRKLAKDGITTSFLRPTNGQKSGILERGFWPGDKITFGPSHNSGVLSTGLFSGYGNYGSSGYSLLKSIDLRTKRGGPSTVPRADQGTKIWNLYNMAQKKQHFGDSPTWFQRPGFIDRGNEYERPGFIQF